MKSLELELNTHGNLSIINNSLKIKEIDKSYLISEMKRLFEKSPAYSGLKLKIYQKLDHYYGELSLFSGSMKVIVSADRKAVPILFDDLNYKLNNQLNHWLKDRFRTQAYDGRRSIA